MEPAMLRVTPDHDHYGRLLRFEQSQTRRFGRPRFVRYLDNRRYYYGENADPDNVEQPLGIRYVPRVIDKHTHYLWGEWERDIVNWAVTPRPDPDGNELSDEMLGRIQNVLYTFLRRANANDVFYRVSLDSGIYGDGVFKLRHRGFARIESVLPEYYHAMWHPLDVGETIEVCVAYNLDRQVALRLFGTAGNPRFYNPQSMLDPGMATVWEWWSPEQMMLVVDDVIVVQGANPYVPTDGTMMSGWIPFIHVPNLPINGEYFGFGDAEMIHGLQDELNMRLADMGDIVNYNAHPITLLRNVFGSKENFEVGPDKVWDLGREGEARYLEWSGTPPAVFQYLEMILRVLFDTANLTPIAFGRAEQSQASGSALVVQMLPIVERVRRKRAVWSPRLSQLARRLIELELMAVTEPAFRERYGFGMAELNRAELHPRWHPILPRDRLQVVNENIGLLVNKARSIERALEDLGEDDPQREYRRIIEDLQTLGRIAIDLAEEEARLTAVYGVDVKAPDLVNRDGGKNNDRASGGSNTDP